MGDGLTSSIVLKQTAVPLKYPGETKGLEIRLLKLTPENTLEEETVPHPYKIVLSRALEKDEATRLRSVLEDELGLTVSQRRIGKREHLQVICETDRQANQLPAGFFVINRNKSLTPRTISLDDHVLSEVTRTLETYGFSETADEFSLSDREYRLVTREGWTRLELSPLTGSDFSVFLGGMLAKEPLLQKVFQTYRYNSRLFPSERAAKEFMLGLIDKYQEGRWFYHDLNVQPTKVGVGRFRKNAWYVRAISPEPEASDLLSEGFSPAKRYSHKMRMDMAQQDEQRLWWELKHPVMRDPSGAMLSPEQLETLTDRLLDHVAAIDLETVGYLPDRLAPRPSGMIVHAVLRSACEKLLFTHQDFAPLEDTVSGYTIVRCPDSLALVQALNEAASAYAFVACHNIKGFDLAHLTFLNSRHSASDVESRFESHLRNLPNDVKMDTDRVTAMRQSLEEAAQTVNYLRRGVKGAVWTHHNLIDTLLFATKRIRLTGGEGIEALTGEAKTEDYDALNENFRTKTPEGLLENATYTTDDGEKTWKLLQWTLPVLVGEAAQTGRPIDHVASSQSYHNELKAITKHVQEHGKHHRGHIVVRSKLQELEEEEKQSLEYFRTHALANAKPGVLRGPINYNPLILASHRKLLGHFPGFVAMNSYAQNQTDPAYRLYAFQATEAYLAPILNKIHTALLHTNRTLAQPFASEDELIKAMNRGKNTIWHDARIAAELSIPQGYRLAHSWEALHRTYKELANQQERNMLELGKPFMHVGPYLLGVLPQRFTPYYLGDAASIVLPGKRLLSTIALPNGEQRFLASRIRIPKKDNAVRADIAHALLTGEPLTYQPKTERMQDVYRTISGMLFPQALEPAHNI